MIIFPVFWAISVLFSSQMSLLPCFQLSLVPSAQGMTRPGTAPPAELCLNLGIEPCDSPECSETPANSKKMGSFNWNQENGWAMEWAGITEFDTWLKEEQLAKSIKFILSCTKTGTRLWSGKQTYVCSRQMSRGQKQYNKKLPDQQRKIDSKKTGCQCQIEIKSYLHTETILGRYKEDHDHGIQLANIPYTCLS